jgi:hypothetical protein
MTRTPLPELTQQQKARAVLKDKGAFKTPMVEKRETLPV